ncbi:MAG: anti-sigma factor [Candidatus Eremiobacteraeota bacterium]|nr:anti-sigma factor [Candidatus Eremiobacteraeota bacterium]
MNGHDEAMLDDVALLALGVLSAADAARVADHARACPICRAEYASLRGAADLLGYSAELAATASDELAAARLKSRVMGEVRGRSESAPARPRALASARPWYAYAAVAAALAIAILSSINNSTLRSANDRERIRVAALERQSSEQRSDAAAAAARARLLDARLAALLAPGAKHYGVPGGEVVTRGGRVIIALRRTAPLAPGKVYQAWTLARGAKRVAPSVTFTPDGNGTAFVELPEAADRLTAVAVSIEPRGGSRAPTSKPAFIRPLS